MKAKFKKGQIIEIYQKWRTEEDKEGKAKLIKFVFSGDDFEYWEVRFITDNINVVRFILIK